MDLAELTRRVEAVSAGYGRHLTIERTTEWMLLKLTEEVGELVQAHLTLTGQSRNRGRSSDEAREQVADELADVVAMCLVFAHRQGIDVAAAITRKWGSYSAFHGEPEPVEAAAGRSGQ